MGVGLLQLTAAERVLRAEGKEVSEGTFGFPPFVYRRVART